MDILTSPVANVILVGTVFKGRIPFVKSLYLAGAMALFSIPAMAACPAGLSPTTSPACETGTLKQILADGTSNCFVVEVLESGHTWAVSTNSQVPSGVATTDMLVHGLMTHIIKGDLASLIGSGAMAPECGFPTPAQIGQVR